MRSKRGGGEFFIPIKVRRVKCLEKWNAPSIWCMKTIHPVVGIIPLEGKPIIIVADLSQGSAKGQTWVSDIRIMLNPHQPKVQRELDNKRPLPKEVKLWL